MTPAASSSGAVSTKSSRKAAKASMSPRDYRSRATSTSGSIKTSNKGGRVPAVERQRAGNEGKADESDASKQKAAGVTKRPSGDVRTKRKSVTRQSPGGPDTSDHTHDLGKSRSRTTTGTRSEQSRSKKSLVSNRGVIYLGHLPQGFFEPQLRKFFSQFGKVTRVELRRSKRTGNSKGFAFVEFELPEVADIVAEAMNNYMMFGRTLVCHVVPPQNLSEKVFSNADKKFKRAPSRLIAAGKHNKAEGEMASARQVNRKIVSGLKKQQRLKELGIDYTFKTVLDDLKDKGDAEESGRHRRSVQAWVQAQLREKKQRKQDKAMKRRETLRLKSRKRSTATGFNEVVSPEEMEARKEKVATHPDDEPSRKRVKQC
ncbi:RNA recognition motif-containing protein [Toxoplasma gondii TgCatPRC2]|uniref:RNA recognition motif-containing protein n=3 Tax=Toxoplasma gondii TaxID=5811 RepID=A0A151HFA6_TOXGO|nr:RNA recognition motif-containing protein [Toxoplasma gondii ME49]EPT26453.1 RNA recognition motif-containing protein [Toxoplasma gondii ME49]KFG36101.1 RNA recognition motif-containing protein [Toxoplasma gondii GAB2-2007-GAL-DOM2]KYK68052.1 RNA recognition motif-containing protein [Toxoplasma gondii TgCatPRC2]|eukprot:XP_002370859.1 RNA recognition motif-containing protein [Toxoplasma gondii ME49]